MDERRRRALITRPREDSADVAVALARRRITPVLAPMIEIRPLQTDVDEDLGEAQAILFTSRNGVRAFCRVSRRRDLPVYAVGDSTAALARDNGFRDVVSAGGDSADLARLVSGRLDPADGPLFHAAGATVAGDLAESLTRTGFTVARRTVYEAHPVGALTDDVATALREGELDIVLFFSPRTAEIFVTLLRDAGLTGSVRRIIAVCLSAAVRAKISDLSWRRVHVAAAPTSEALIEAIDEPPAADDLEGDGDGEGDAAGAGAGNSALSADGKGGYVPVTSPSATAGNHNEGGRPGEAPDQRTPPGTSPSGTTTPDMTSEDRKPADDSPGPAPDDGARAAADRPDAPETPAKESKEAAPRAAPAPAADAGATPARRRGAGAAVAWTVLVIAVVLGAAYWTLPQWRASLPNEVRRHLAGTDTGLVDQLRADLARSAAALAAATTRIAGLEKSRTDATAESAALRARVDGLTAERAALMGRLAETERRLATAAAAAARLDAAERELSTLQAAQARAAELAAEKSALETRLQDLRETIAAAAAVRDEARKLAEARTADLAAARRRIGELEATVAKMTQAAQLSSRGDAFTVAALRLRGALAAPGGAAAELAAARDTGAGRPGLDAILDAVAPAAATAPERADLLAGLGEAVDAAAAADAPKSADWVDAAVRKLRSFVSIRRIDGSGDDTEAILAGAERAADRGDLAAALKEMNRLTGAPANATEEWRRAAEARLAREQAIEALDRLILDTVSGTAGE